MAEPQNQLPLPLGPSPWSPSVQEVKFEIARRAREAIYQLRKRLSEAQNGKQRCAILVEIDDWGENFGDLLDSMPLN